MSWLFLWMVVTEVADQTSVGNNNKQEGRRGHKMATLCTKHVNDYQFNKNVLNAAEILVLFLLLNNSNVSARHYRHLGDLLVLMLSSFFD